MSRVIGALSKSVWVTAAFGGGADAGMAIAQNVVLRRPKRKPAPTQI